MKRRPNTQTPMSAVANQLSRLAPATPKHAKLVAICGAILTTLSLIFFAQPAARAAEAGAGYSIDGRSASFIGAMQFEAMNAYCLELHQPSPIGHPTRIMNANDQLPAAIAQLSDTTRAQLHWVVSHMGASDDPINTATVAIFVWSVADPEHYRGDDHYFSLIPAENREAVAGRLRGLREAAAKIREIDVPNAFAIKLEPKNEQLTLSLPELPTGTAIELLIEGGSINDERQLTVPGEQATSMRVDPIQGADSIRVDARLKPADGYWSANARFLVTEGHQLLLQAQPNVGPTTQATIHLTHGLRHTPGTPPPARTTPSAPPATDTPPSTPPAKTVPEQTVPEETTPTVSAPPATATSTPPFIEEPSDEPTSETPPSETTDQPTPTDTIPVTSSTTATATPKSPEATYSYSTVDPGPGDSAGNPGGEPQPSQSGPAQLATTGFPGYLLTVAGVGVTLLGAGGWLVSKKRNEKPTEAW